MNNQNANENNTKVLISTLYQMRTVEMKSIKEIAEELRINESTVKRWLKDANITKGAKPYVRLSKNLVLYKDKVYEKLTGKKLRDALHKSLTKR